MNELLDWVAPAVEVLLKRGIDWKRYCIAAALPLPVREGNFSDDGRTLISGGSTGRTVQIVQVCLEPSKCQLERVPRLQRLTTNV